ncbi:MAG: GAF domain-containing sensor histidine kinase [Chloroflexi bacterium]|nr:GAF domain-containing sensor histidine kinase [Chloroflexota bacterium]
MLSRIKNFFFSDRVFTFLVIFRWASLLPALFTLNMENEQGQFLSPLWTLGIAALVNLFISLFNRPLNKLVVDYPAALGLDLVFSAGILFISGGARSPYFLYALSPLLAGSFFFQMRGALVSAAFFTPLYLAANQFDLSDGVSALTQLAGVWLIPILFAYPSSLLKTINQARDELSAARDELTRQNESLSAAHRQLKVIHDLTVLLQAAPDLISVQQRVLGAVTTGLGFRRAVVALVDPAREEIGSWLLYPVNSSFPSIEALSLNSENGEIFKSLIERKPYRTGVEGEVLVNHPDLNSWLKTCRWLVYPLSLREYAVGILMVELDKHEELTRQREDVVTLVANQAALALGTTILCIDRARRLAVETERNRIARDIHDTVAQSLFGIAYSLDACVNMLPEHAEDVKKELTDLRTLASGAHDEVRRSIFDLWPSSLTMDIFQADLVNYVNSCCRPRAFSIIFNHSGDFNALPSGLRRAVYRMAQEALANSARHSGASSARLCLNVHDNRVDMSISDEGRGFDPTVALSRSVNREHFGLHGIQERARALGGECEIISAPGKGTRVMIEIPINGHPHA